MKSRPIIMMGIAVVFGAVSIFVADVWMGGETNARPIIIEKKIVASEPVQFSTIVVAAKALRYGDKIDAASLVEIPWPQDRLPVGAYKSISQATSDGERLVLSAIETNEPLLLSKLSGIDGRAALSNKLSSGMRAVSIAVDDVSGVAGFITPGDRVDIVLIRSGEKMSADVILQNVKVVSVDQAADERRTGAKVANSVTVEVSGENAKQLALAKATGKLSLTLRAAGDESVEQAEGSGILGAISSFLEDDTVPRQRTVFVTRGLTPTPYIVVNEEYILENKTAKTGIRKPVQ